MVEQELKLQQYLVEILVQPQQLHQNLWNGTSWTSTPSLNTARRNMAGFGTTNMQL
jgi:hypothetical protein